MGREQLRGMRRKIFKQQKKKRTSLTRLVSSPLPGTCPSCSMPYDRSQKRRLVDSCGHERCYSCIGTNNLCSLCLQTGIRIGDSSSILMETSLSSSGSSQVFRQGRPCRNTQDTLTSTSMLDIDRKKRPRLVNSSLDSGVFSTSSP